MKQFTTMNKDYFATGFNIDTYLEEVRSYRSLVRSLIKDAQVDKATGTALKSALADHPGPVLATVHTEPWCGDSACNLPILRPLFAAAEIPFRVFDQEQHPELKEYYRADGEGHIPVVSLWDGPGREIARWVEAPAAVQPLKQQWKAEHPRLMELYALKADDPAAEKEFARLYRSFLEDMALWYKEGKWDETVKEIINLAETAHPRQ